MLLLLFLIAIFCIVRTFGTGVKLIIVIINIWLDEVKNSVAVSCICKKCNFTWQGSFPEHLKTASNSIVCTESDELLREVFNLSPAPVYPVSLPFSDSCSSARSQCDACLYSQSCLSHQGRYSVFNAVNWQRNRH